MQGGPGWCRPCGGPGRSVRTSEEESEVGFSRSGLSAALGQGGSTSIRFRTTDLPAIRILSLIPALTLLDIRRSPSPSLSEHVRSQPAAQ